MTNPFTVTPLTVTPGRGEGGGEPFETGRGCMYCSILPGTSRVLVC